MSLDMFDTIHGHKIANTDEAITFLKSGTANAAVWAKLSVIVWVCFCLLLSTLTYLQVCLITT